MLSWSVSASTLVLLLLTAASAAPAPPTANPAALPRIAPLEPREALSSFRLRPGFRIELVASEPLIRDPIEICFDENGRLFVVEMIDYSELRDARPHLGRIRLLEDTNDDGHFDRSRVFADDLPWPTGVFCWNNGVFVAATPDLLYLEDTNGDGSADTRLVVLTGFASDFAPYRTNQLNMQAMLNSLRWGLDNRIHGVTGPNGGDVGWPSDPTPINLRGRDFALDPRLLLEGPAADTAAGNSSIPPLVAEAGGGQYGLCFDDRGRRFTCNNSDHIRVFMAEARYVTRNPWFDFPPILPSIAADGPSAEVFRTSAEEPWRVLRTQWRVAGLVPGPIEGGGRASGYFTSATGITIYRGDAWPRSYLGDAFIADCGSNLVHRKKLHAEGVALMARRPDDELASEFLTSSDVWFRPVQFANAPDGTLHIIDMYREIIEHPWSLPPDIKQHLDLNSGNERGRIYRIVPDDFKPRPAPRLGRANTAELVQTLAHPNAWHRETAARLIYAQQDRPNAQPALEHLLRSSSEALGRLHALYALDGLAALAPGHLVPALADADDRVREHSVRLSERWLAGSSPEALSLQTALLRLTDDPSPQVRYQLAFTLGEFDPARRVHALAHIVRRDLSSPWIRSAVLSSLATGTGEMFELLRPQFQHTDASSEDAAAYAFLEELVEVIGARNAADEVDAVLQFAQTAKPAVAFTLLHALGQGLQRARSPLPPHQLAPLLARALNLAADRSSLDTTRVQAVELLGLSRFADAGTTLLGLLRLGEPAAVQSAALRTLGRFTDPVIADALLEAWPTLTPRLRQETLPILLGRAERIAALLEAVESQAIRRSDFSSVQLDFLMNHRDSRIRAEAVRLLTGVAKPTREEALEQFKAALELPGQAARARPVYVERCASCHRLGGDGFQLGPDLSSVRNMGKERLLIGILDPNREVLPQYLAYEIETRDEESLLGIVVNETSATLTLRQAYARETIIPRQHILNLRGLGTSIMPEALETGLSPQDMADLLEFIATAHP